MVKNRIMLRNKKAAFAVFILIGLVPSENAVAAASIPFVSLPNDVLLGIASELDARSVVALAKTCRRMDSVTCRNRFRMCRKHRIKSTFRLIEDLREIHKAVWETFGSLWPFMRGFGPMQMLATRNLVERTVAEFLMCSSGTQNARELYIETLCRELKGEPMPGEINHIDGFLYPDYPYSEADEALLNALAQRRNEVWECYSCSIERSDEMMKRMEECDAVDRAKLLHQALSVLAYS